MKPRTDYQAQYHAEHPREAINRVEAQRCRERLAHFWAVRHLVYKTKLPAQIDPESREFKEAAKEIHNQIAAGKF